MGCGVHLGNNPAKAVNQVEVTNKETTEHIIHRLKRVKRLGFILSVCSHVLGLSSSSAELISMWIVLLNIRFGPVVLNGVYRAPACRRQLSCCRHSNDGMCRAFPAVKCIP
jgi:hypothetical protein